MIRKTLYPLLCALGLFLIGGLLYPAIHSLTEALWGYLVYLFPDRLTTYNPMTGGEEYLIFERISRGLSVLATLFLCFYLSLRLDNGRFEYTARLRDGKFHLFEGYRHYFSNYLLSDLVIATLPPLISTLPAAFIPKRIMNAGLDIPFWCGGALMPYLGAALSLAAAFVLACLARVIAALIAVRRYRAAWLSGGI